MGLDKPPWHRLRLRLAVPALPFGLLRSPLHPLAFFLSSQQHARAQHASLPPFLPQP